MESNNNNDDIELIQIAIQRLIDDQNNNKKKTKKKRFFSPKSNDDVHDNDNDNDDDDQILLSRLLSQLESLKEHEPQVEVIEEEDEEMEVNSSVVEVVDNQVKKSEDKDKDDEIGPVLVEVKEEIRKLKKQNTITHCLLSVMILITLAWQYSEVSLILKVKNRFIDPFKSFGDMFNFKARNPLLIHQDDDANNKTSSSSDKHDAPMLPQLDLSSLGFDADED